MQVMYSGRAPHTKESLPDFLKWCRVTRHPLVFCGLTGSQRTPGNGASHLQNEHPKPQPGFLLNAASSEHRSPVHSLYLK